MIVDNRIECSHNKFASLVCYLFLIRWLQQAEFGINPQHNDVFYTHTKYAIKFRHNQNIIVMD